MSKLNTSQARAIALVKPNFRLKFRRLEAFTSQAKALKRWLAKSSPDGLAVEITGTTKGAQMLSVLAVVSDGNPRAKLNTTTQLLLIGSTLPEGQALVAQLSGWINLKTSHPDNWGITWAMELGGIMFTQRLDGETGLFSLTARAMPMAFDKTKLPDDAVLE